MRMGWRVALSGLVGVTLACGGDDDGGNGPDRSLARAPANSGEAQTGPTETALTDSIRVLVTQDGTPEAGVSVNWSTSVAGAELSPATSVTDANGLAAASWRLGVVSGAQLASASVSGAGGSPVRFHATATGGRGATFGTTFFRSNRNLSQDPAVDTIAAGTAFVWSGTGGEHTVRSQGAPSFTSSGPLNGDDTYSLTFPTAGTYVYDCQIHGSGMTGRIVVQ
jgi:plastocyanin